jgi:hypothetical protein
MNAARTIVAPQHGISGWEERVSENGVARFQFFIDDHRHCFATDSLEL